MLDITIIHKIVKSLTENFDGSTRMTRFNYYIETIYGTFRCSIEMNKPMIDIYFDDNFWFEIRKASFIAKDSQLLNEKEREFDEGFEKVLYNKTFDILKKILFDRDWNVE